MPGENIKAVRVLKVQPTTTVTTRAGHVNAAAVMPLPALPYQTRQPVRLNIPTKLITPKPVAVVVGKGPLRPKMPIMQTASGRGAYQKQLKVPALTITVAHAQGRAQDQNVPTAAPAPTTVIYPPAVMVRLVVPT